MTFNTGETFKFDINTFNLHSFQHALKRIIASPLLNEIRCRCRCVKGSNRSGSSIRSLFLLVWFSYIYLILVWFSIYWTDVLVVMRVDSQNLQADSKRSFLLIPVETTLTIALMILNSRFEKNNSVPSSEFSSKKVGSAEMEPYEETEVTVSEEDDAIYGYNTYSHEKQRRPGIPEAVSRMNGESFANPAEVDSHSLHRMPRRSSLKSSSATPRQFRRHSLTCRNW